MNLLMVYLPSEDDKQLLLFGVMSNVISNLKSKGLWNLIMNFLVVINVDVNRSTNPD